MFFSAKVILLLTDGQIKDQPGDVISTEIALFNNSVDLFVFGICQIGELTTYVL